MDAGDDRPGSDMNGGRGPSPPTGFLGRTALVVLVVALVFLAWKASNVLLLVFFGTLFGFMGILVAAPRVAVLYVLVEQVYLEGVLDEPISKAGGERA